MLLGDLEGDADDGGYNGEDHDFKHEDEWRARRAGLPKRRRKGWGQAHARGCCSFGSLKKCDEARGKH